LLGGKSFGMGVGSNERKGRTAKDLKSFSARGKKKKDNEFVDIKTEGD